MPVWELMRLVLALTILVLVVGSTACRSAEHYVQQGDQLLGAHKYPQAVLAYRNATQKDGRSAQTLYKLGRAQRAVNDNTGALASFSRALALNPEFAEARGELGDVYLGAYLVQPANGGMYYKILEQADWLLKKNPRSYAGLRLRGYLALSDKNPEEALSYFQRANEIRPWQPDTVLSITQALLITGHYDQARKLALDLIEKNRSFGPIYDVLYAYAVSTGHTADAEALLKQKVSNNPGNPDFAVQLAAHYWRTGEKAAASHLLEGLLTGQAPWESYVRVGRFYKSVGEWDRALATLDQGVSRQARENLKYQEEKAGVLIAAGRPKDAILILNQVLQHEPSASNVKKMRALLLLESPGKEDRERALQELQSMAGPSHEDPELLFQLGRAYAINGKPEQAKETFELVIRKNSRDLATLVALADLTSRSKQFQQSLQYSQRALSIDPTLPGARLLHATALVGMGQLDNARSDYVRVVHDQPGYTEAKLQLALLDVAQKRFGDAEKLFREVYRPNDGDFRALKGLAEMYAAEGEWDKALELLGTEASRFPKAMFIQQLLASTADRAGRLNLAIQQYQTILQQKSGSDAAAYTALGQLFQRQHDLSQSIAMLQKARDLAPEDWRTTARLAMVQQEAGLLSEAKASYRQALKLGADTADILNNLAYVEAETTSDLEDALALTKRALSQAPGNPQYADTLGFIYLKQKKIASALDVFRTLSLRHPENATFRYHLALALFHNGDSIGARRELRAALAVDPSLVRDSKIDLPSMQ
jgi:tetratricopeptide (TPR) repeat protein